jgi:protein-disulfide isomerase
MLGFINNHKILLTFMLIVIGFFVFMLLKEPSSSQPTDSNPFKTVETTNQMSRGNKNAKVSIIQYSDFLCPSCSYFSTQIMPTIESSYIATDKVKFEFRPMAFIADGSLQSGMGGFCAIDQNKFWQYHDAIYKFVAQKTIVEGKDPKTETILTADLVKDIASSSGLDKAKFDSCLDSKKHLNKITESTNLANQNGVTGTPYIMINGQPYQGNMTLNAFEALVKASL